MRGMYLSDENDWMSPGDKLQKRREAKFARLEQDLAKLTTRVVMVDNGQDDEEDGPKAA